MIPPVRYLKMADSAVQREKPAISPRNVSDQKRPFLEILKIKNSRDTKLVVGRELRKGNPSSKSIGRRRKIRIPFYHKPDRRRIWLDRESGQAIFDLGEIHA